MIVQACINGARPLDYHPKLPLTAADMARDSADCVSAGAAELHIHPRNMDRYESLSVVDETILAVRHACPGTLIGVSTGAWIENDIARTRAAIAAWRVLPDYASVNLSEPDAPAIIALLYQQGVGVEAGLATVADAKRLVGLGRTNGILRILIELDAGSFDAGKEIVTGIEQVLSNAGVLKPILLHGANDTVWPFVRMAFERSWSTRVGLEDGKTLPDGSEAPSNAAIVAAAVALRHA